MRRLACHRNSAILFVFLAGAAPRGFQTPATEHKAEYVVLSEGRPIGTESVTVTQSADGWSMSASETLGPPVNLSTSRFLLRYTADWRPVSLSIEGALGNGPLTLNTTFADGEARTQGTQQGQPINVTQPVSPQAIVIPAGFFVSYAGLAARLASASPGSAFQLYILPQGEVTATVTRVTPRRFLTPAGPVDLRQFDMTLATGTTPTGVEVWVDGRGMLARLAVAGSGLVVIRNELSSAMTREETVSRPGDQEVFIPALGFTIAATMSKPSGVAARAPAVLLIGGAGLQDRDEVTGRVPVFGHFANAIADAGFLVLRYDKRGVGRTGGRTESATVSDYADDARVLVKWLRQRRDVDPNRVAVLGYAEGGALALLTAQREDKIAAVVLTAAPGVTGREVTLLQQQLALASTAGSDADRQTRTAQQEQVIAAVLKGTGWETIPPAVRRQADTPWFKSWLLFDPALVVPKVKQPMLIVAGALDAEFPPSQADRLEMLARARNKLPPTATQKVIVPGVNHLFAEPSGAAVAAPVTAAIVDWLKTTLPPKK
jgi:pimeloyl-ACP methyl ester carboxylesterase